MDHFHFKFDEHLADKAHALQQEFGWRFESQPEDRFCLQLSTEGLSLIQLGERMRPLLVDWANGLSLERIRRQFTKRDPWVKALGTSSDFPNVIDATLGLGHDAFIMAVLGFNVTAFERNSVVFALARDACGRLPPEFESVRDRLQLIYGDFVKIPHSAKYDLVYLDPMFPERKKSALVKKELRWLRELVDINAADESQLFKQALQLEPRKIVVKRPKGSPAISDFQHQSFAGQSTRYDVYFGARAK